MTDAAPSLRPPGALGVAAAAWGLAGVTALLLNAVGRLLPMSVEALTAHPLSPGHLLLTALSVGFLGYFEGYRGFQRGFSPRVVVRALHLARNPRPLHVAVAPLYCMGLVHASRRRLIASWVLTAMIVVFVVSARQLPQPYRGIVDAGVVVGLGWGLVALVAFAARALAGRPPPVPAELPAGPARA